jgi:4-amino-4-deoxy-L-arabinose transferase-like glycosyltransferase
MKNLFEQYFRTWLLLISALCFLPFLGIVHLFDWDEINFAESAREMIASGNFTRVQIDYKPFWEKPPLFFWMQVLCMKAFGISDFAARLPNAIAGIITLQLLYTIGAKINSPAFGRLWSLCYLGSLLPHFYFTSGIIDPVFNLFIFLSLYFFIRATEENKKTSWHPLLSGLFAGLAVLTKGPVGFLILFLTVAFQFFRNPYVKNIRWFHYMAFAFVVLLVSSAWYAYEIIQNGTWFIKQFISYQIELLTQPVATHGQPFYYHFVVLFFGCFPIAQFAFPSLLRKKDNHTYLHRFEGWMQALFWIVLILFSLVSTKIVHYSSMCYLPLSFIAALSLDRGITHNKAVKWMYFIVAFLFGLAFVLLPMIGYFKHFLIPYIRDPFAVEALLLPVQWLGYEWLAGVFFVVSSVYFFRAYCKNSSRFFLYGLFIANAFVFTLLLVAVVPRVEEHSQGSAIQFYRSLQGKQVYVTTYGFKSYAQYFYFRKPFGERPESSDIDWLLKGAIDKPVHLVTRINKVQEMDQFPEFKKTGSRGGFVYFCRQPTTQ